MGKYTNKKALELVFEMLLFQPMVRLHFFYITHDLLLPSYGGMNTSLSTTGEMNVYFYFAKDVDIFAKFIINFNSDNINVNFMNKTVSWCKVLQVPRYEPLIKIAYRVFSEKSHLPQKCPFEKVCYFLSDFFVHCLFIYFRIICITYQILSLKLMNCHQFYLKLMLLYT